MGILAAANVDLRQNVVQIDVSFTFTLPSLSLALMQILCLAFWIGILSIIKSLVLLVAKPWTFAFVIALYLGSLQWLQDVEIPEQHDTHKYCKTDLKRTQAEWPECGDAWFELDVSRCFVLPCRGTHSLFEVALHVGLLSCDEIAFRAGLHSCDEFACHGMVA
jgi:hypothetical protein